MPYYGERILDDHLKIILQRFYNNYSTFKGMGILSPFLLFAFQSIFALNLHKNVDACVDGFIKSAQRQLMDKSDRDCGGQCGKSCGSRCLMVSQIKFVKLVA